jgi:hypothetical protein
MGYGYSETFLIVFLTHPSVIIPDIATLLKMAPQLPSELAAFANVPPQLNALWQVFWVWVLSLPGTKSPGFAWTMYAVYIFFLMVYAYLFVSLRFSKGA